jgi:hypothetical protein
LVAREQGNPTFHFLKPTHSLFGYFKDLCDAYSRTLMPNKELLAKLKQDAAADRTGLLERCLKRLEWEKQRDAMDKAASDKAEAERVAMQSIDWSVTHTGTHTGACAFFTGAGGGRYALCVALQSIDKPVTYFG